MHHSITTRPWKMCATLMAALALATSPALASDGFRSIDSGAILGGALGGGAGAAIGSGIGGRNGAIIGGALGAAAGVALTSQQRPVVIQKRYVHQHHHYDEHDRGRRGHGKHHKRHH